jgi:hypothetical protein
MMVGNETVRPSQVCELQETLCAGSAQSAPPAVLREGELPAGAQGVVGPAVAGQAGEPRVLERAGKCRSSAGVAEGASGLLERAQEKGPSLTSRLRAGSLCFAGNPKVLQDVWRMQPPLLLGLISRITGTLLHTDMAEITGQLIANGRALVGPNH